MAQITMSPSEFNTVAGILENDSNEMSACFKRMCSIIDNLRSSWNDSNGTGFVNRWDNEIKDQLHIFSDAIMEYSHYVSGANKIYQETYTNPVHSSINGTN